MHAHADGERPRVAGVGEVHERQAVEPPLWMSLDRFHGENLRPRKVSHCRTVAVVETTRTAPR